MKFSIDYKVKTSNGIILDLHLNEDENTIYDCLEYLANEDKVCEINILKKEN